MSGFHDPAVDQIREAMDRADAARVRLPDAIAASDQATQRRAEHATEAIRALIPRFTDPEEETMTQTITIVGQGVLTWPRGERVSDRYGVVGLMSEGGQYADLLAQGMTERDALIASYMAADPDWINVHTIPEGARGRLQATVLRTRKSGHIGDLFRGLSPTTPGVGEVIVLGNGTVFHDDGDGSGIYIGLRPDDNRDTDWLDPQALYRAHEQTVELQFIPEERP